MTRKLPPLNALRAFEAAARHLSFTKAADELHVTPAAVSQQVKTLEEFCGVQLFRRLTRALVLTDAGQLAMPPLREGFDKLAEAADKLKPIDPSGQLTVSVPPSFGAKWLVPRLGRFSAAHPEFELRIDATDALVDFDNDSADVAVRYGRGEYPDLTTRRLIEEISFPVCAPALLEGAHPLLKIEDLAHHTLLHVMWRIEDDSSPNWRMWLRAAGLETINAERGPRFNADGLAIQAAIEGQGVILIESSIVADDLKAGRLVRPFGPASGRATSFCYYLVYPPANREMPKVQAFEEWMIREIELSAGAQ